MTQEEIHALAQAVERQRIHNTEYKAYREDDQFTCKGKPLCSVLDFWRFSYSQLLGMSDTIAEFLVCKAIGIEKAENVNYWTAYDLSFHGKRIEMKATSYIHPWNKRLSNNRVFSIAPSDNRYWRELPGQDSGEKLARQSEVYVFCLNSDKDIANPNPLNVDKWEFYVIPTFEINAYCNKAGNPYQKTIRLSVVQRLAGRSLGFQELKKAIEASIELSDQHYLNLQKD